MDKLIPVIKLEKLEETIDGLPAPSDDHEMEVMDAKLEDLHHSMDIKEEDDNNFEYQEDINEDTPSHSNSHSQIKTEEIELKLDKLHHRPINIQDEISVHKSVRKEHLIRHLIPSIPKAAMANVSTVSFIVPPLAAAAFSFIAAQVLKKRIKSRRKRQRRLWTKEIFRKRFEYGNRLMKDMQVELVDDLIMNFTRITTEDFEHLVSLIGPKIEKMNTNMRKSITVKERLAITLRYLATGDSYTSLQYLFRVSKSSISLIVSEVCEAIIEALQDYVKMPSSKEEWLEKASEFEDKWSFPHAIGAIDGKQVMIQAPAFSGTEFYNNKKFSSIALFALVDANYNFMYVDVGCQGRTSDGGVFKNPTLYKKIERRELQIPEPCALRIPYLLEVPYMIFADKAFAMNDYTIKPFDGNPEVGSPERAFNYRISQGLRVVENALGILSAVFRVLRKSMTLKPEIASKVVLATIHLHNFLRQRSSCAIYTPPGSFDTEKDGVITNGNWRNEQPSLEPIRNLPLTVSDRAKTVRSHLADHFVLNDVLPWQNEY